MLGRALVFSLVLHFAILLSAEPPVFPSGATSRPARTPLIASVGKPLVATGETLDKHVGLALNQPPVRSERSKQQIRAATAPALAPSAEPSAMLEPRPAGESDRHALSGKDGATIASPPVESLDVVSLEGLQQYRLNLAREARRFRQYPAYARERGWEGEVVVVLSAQPGSDAPMLTLGKGSGHELLDQQALEMMNNAVRRAHIPDALSGKRFKISVPVQFRLDD